MKKILIIWISWTGKTRISKKLSEILNIPVTHYDVFVWWENWQEVDEKIVEKKLIEAVYRDKWIIEWFIHPAWKIRLEKADTIIYLDYSGFQAMLGWLQRQWKYRWVTRPEMASGCTEKLDLRQLKLMYNRLERPEIEEAIKGFEEKIIRLKSRREVDKFLAWFKL